MKNLHLLPTEKPSRLKQNKITKKYSLVTKGIDLTMYTPQNIYITSDEETKDGDWCLDKFNQRWKLEDGKLIAFDSEGIKRFSTDNILGHECKKIILTTDQDLIIHGVQAIDDEFLEWFVKNPSCEEVEFLYEPKNFLDIKQGWEYLIISKIIKEEHTQENQSLKIAKSNCLLFADNMFEEIKSNLHKGDWKDWKNVSEMLEEHQYHFEKLKNSIESNTLHLIKEHLADCGNILMFIGNQYNLYCNSLSKEEQTDILEVGQILVNEETLEYGLLQYIKICLECNNESQAIRLLEKYGFEKQEERYSKEDMEEMYSYGYNNFLPLEEAFKQFKKK